MFVHLKLIYSKMKNILINCIGIKDSGGITVLEKLLNEIKDSEYSYLIICNQNQNIDFDDIHEQIINLCNIASYMMKHNSIDLLKDKDFTCEYLKQIRGKNLHSSSGTLKDINKNNSNYQRPEENKDNINILKFNDYSSKYKLVTPSS